MLGTKFLKSARENYYVSGILAALTRPVHRGCRTVAAQLERKVRKNGAAIPLPNGKVMRFAPDSGVTMGSLLFWNGLEGFEPHTSRTLRFFFERVTTFVDVGANYGFYSMLAGLWNPNLHVIAFEPVPQIFQALTRNLILNRIENHVSAHQFALADTTGPAPFYLPERRGRDFESTGTLVADGERSTKLSTTIAVKTIRFDDFEKANSMRIDLIKIDAEDAESLVLAGMERTIQRDRPFIVCEILQQPHGNVKTRAIVDALGYTPYWITPSGYIRVSGFDFPRSRSQNFLLSPVAPQGEVIVDLEHFWSARHPQ